MRMLGIALLVLGFVGLLYGGITYSSQNEVLYMGGVKVSATERKSIPIPAIAGVLGLIGGAALLIAGRRWRLHLAAVTSMC